jgi:hypothetical protein
VITCRPYGLLDESGIDEKHKYSIVFSQWYDTQAFFPTGESELPFDIFSAAFFLTSHYEEYLGFTADEHNRFPAHESILVNQGRIEDPLVNEWALIIKKILIKSNSELTFNPRNFEFKSTIDIDQAWKFKHKGIVRNTVGSVRDLLRGKWENLLARWPVLLGFQKDAFHEAFSWHKNLEKKYGLQPYYFILLGDYAKYDKNISYDNTEFQNLIKSLDDKGSLGIHPSYQSNANDDFVSEEKGRLENILSRKITRSRQHFLIHTMPNTYHRLLANGIYEDHTMGYSTHLGFRAGIAAPYYWFDLSANKKTELKLFPFCAMDITPLHYRGESPQEATAALHILIDKVHSVGGLFISLWHNESFSETERWRGWSSVYESLLAKAKDLAP